MGRETERVAERVAGPGEMDAWAGAVEALGLPVAVLDSSAPAGPSSPADLRLVSATASFRSRAGWPAGPADPGAVVGPGAAGDRWVVAARRALRTGQPVRFSGGLPAADGAPDVELRPTGVAGQLVATLHDVEGLAPVAEDGSDGEHRAGSHDGRPGNGTAVAAAPATVGGDPVAPSGAPTADTYRRLFDELPSAICLVELVRDAAGEPVDMRFLATNRAFRAVTGFSGVSAVGQTLRGILPVIEDQWIRDHAGAIASGQPRRIEGRIAPIDRWFETWTVPQGGDRAAILFADVTDRHRAEDAVRASERRFRSLFDLSQQGVAECTVVRDAGGEIVDLRFDDVNARFGRQVGYAVEELVGNTLLALNPDAPEEWRQAWRQALATGERVTIRDVGTEGADWFDVELYPAGDDRLLILVSRTTEHRRVQAALREGEAHQRFLLELEDRIRPLHDPDAVMEAAAAQLAGQLGVSVVGYARVGPDGDRVVTGGQYGDGRMPSLVRYEARLSDFGPGLGPALRAGTAIFTEDIRTGSGWQEGGSDAASERSLGAVAMLPLLRDGVLVAYLYAADPDPRPWTGTDRATMRAVADRTWAAVERATAAAELQESEARQAFLLALSDRLGPSSDPAEILPTAAAMLAEHLGVAAAGYALFLDDETIVNTAHAGTGAIPDIGGLQVRVADFGDGIVASLAANEDFFVADVRDDPRMVPGGSEGAAAMRLAALAMVPLFRDGRLVAYQYALHDAVHPWPETDRAIMRAVADRVWLAVEAANASRALQESEARYRSLFETMDQGYCTIEVLFGDDGRVTDYVYREINPAFERYTGLVGAVGRGAREMTPGLEQSWFDAYGEVVRTGEPVRLLQEAAPLGKWFEAYGFRIGEPEDRMVAVLFDDVTARQRDEQEREQARQVAERAVVARDRFLSVGAHELRTPITGLRGSVELLVRSIRRGTADPERLERYATTILESTSRLVALIDDLFDVARLRSGEVGQSSAPVQPTDLGALVRETLAGAHLDRVRSRLAVDLADGPMVAVNPQRIHQVVSNLVDNALKYSPDGGLVDVRLTYEDGTARLCVQDDGIGLPPESLETIFEPFNRAPNAVVSSIPGLGLGLYICRQIAEVHGGRLWAESEGEGRGTTLCLSLPVAGDC